MTETEREEISALREACVDAREIAERSIRARQEAEVALGTLQTALRQLVETWRYRRDVERITAESQAAREAELLEHSADGYDACADELESLLPALEPTP